MIMINTEFDGGAIEVVEASQANDIQLKIAKDNQACTRQWFYFSVQTLSSEAHNIRLLNAADVSFSHAWKGYQALASYNNLDWFAVETVFSNGELQITHQATEKKVFYAYFVPYTLSRQRQLMDDICRLPNSSIIPLGTTPLDHPIDLVRLGDENINNKKVWLIARQHPGETMAQWIIEGVLRSLINNQEALELLFPEVTFYIVANMNPDGSKLGNHRTNAKGINLNRQWAKPDPIKCPEVFVVREAMLRSGVDFFIDIHGDETLPHNFMMVENNHLLGERLKAKLAVINTDFQLDYDYNNYDFGCGGSACCGSECKRNSTATAFVAQHFDAPSILLESSFKPLAKQGTVTSWDHQGCVRLGESLVTALAEIKP
jgi:murein tripeptide amidase MpaA